MDQKLQVRKKFIDKVKPKYVVISVGADNSYHHPTKETLARLSKAKAKTYRTDLNGSITAVSNGKTITFIK